MYDIWGLFRDATNLADKAVPRVGRRPVYTDQLIVKMYFVTVISDRPLCWACDRRHLRPFIRNARIPSVSQFCKRMKTPRVNAMIDWVGEYFAKTKNHTALAFMDGKPLPISESSRDPDARTGRGNGRFSRGFKLHALCDQANRIRAFRITPMNTGEPTVAREYLVQRVQPGTLVLADGNYDGRKLYTAVAERGARLLTPQKKNHRTEAAFLRTSPERRVAMEQWRDEPEATRTLYAKRGQIERIFSALSTYGGGLAPLPSWVRRLDRVTRWVTAKIAIYHARLIAAERAS